MERLPGPWQVRFDELTESVSEAIGRQVQRLKKRLRGDQDGMVAWAGTKTDSAPTPDVYYYIIIVHKTTYSKTQPAHTFKRPDDLHCIHVIWGSVAKGRAKLRKLQVQASQVMSDVVESLSKEQIEKHGYVTLPTIQYRQIQERRTVKEMVSTYSMSFSASPDVMAVERALSEYYAEDLAVSCEHTEDR